MSLQDAGYSSKIRSLARFHFVTGLPRSGVSVLSAILNQNPRFVAGLNGPAKQLFDNARRRLADGGDEADLLDDAQKTAIMRGVIDAIYHDRPFDSVVFDAHQDWLLHVETLVRLYPLCRFVICVRNPAAIVNSLLLSLPEQPQQAQLAHEVERLTSPDSEIAIQISRLREALSSRHAERMLLLDYDRLADDPEDALDVLYDFLREPEIHHDFQEIGGTVAGVSGPVMRSGRSTILPMRTLLQLSGRAFWRNLKRTSATMLLGRAR